MSSTERPRSIRFIPPKTPEVGEIDSDSTFRWFAGALEAGGTVAFGIQHRLSGPKSGHIAAYPFISIYETKEEFVNLLKSQFGGSESPHGDSWGWRLSGYRAAEIIANLEPYVVSRAEIVTAVRNWLESTTPQRVQIAEEMKGYDRFNIGSAEEYKSLISDPAFVAGILDNRGSIYAHSADGNMPRIEISSKNKNLLIALQKRYGGNISIQAPIGTTVKIGERTFVTKRDSELLVLTGKEAQALIRTAIAHLKISPFQGWDRSIKVATIPNKTGLMDRLIPLITQELEQYAHGDLKSLSTAAELATALSFNINTLRTLLYLLPPDLKRARENLMNELESAAEKERQGQISQIEAAVKDELEKYTAGEVSKLSTLDELARKFSLSKRTTKRRLNALPADLRKQREAIIRSTHRRVLTKSEVENLVNSLIRELEEYRQGQRHELTHNEGIAQNAQVGLHIINRNVIVRLPSGVRKERQRILLGQAHRNP